MTESVIVVTGCDANFYSFLEEAIKSLVALGIDQRADIGVLDLGLEPEQLDSLRSLGCTIERPTWTLPVPVPENLRVKHEVGLLARTALRDFFPGYSVYLWFDADAWAQTPEFFNLFVEGAKAKGAAIVRENGTGYKRNWLYNRWWYGHMMASCGPLDGFRVAFPPAINIGIVALSATAPHWQAWIDMYRDLILRRGKANLDQHAFNAALTLNNLPNALLPARCNWIATLSTPFWDPARQLLCEPNATTQPLSVVHLAGPDKRRAYRLTQTTHGEISTPLTYAVVGTLRGVDVAAQRHDVIVSERESCLSRPTNRPWMR